MSDGQLIGKARLLRSLLHAQGRSGDAEEVADVYERRHDDCLRALHFRLSGLERESIRRALAAIDLVRSRAVVAEHEAAEEGDMDEDLKPCGVCGVTHSPECIDFRRPSPGQATDNSEYHLGYLAGIQRQRQDIVPLVAAATAAYRHLADLDVAARTAGVSSPRAVECGEIVERLRAAVAEHEAAGRIG